MDFIIKQILSLIQIFCYIYVASRLIVTQFHLTVSPWAVFFIIGLIIMAQSLWNDIDNIE